MTRAGLDPAEVTIYALRHSSIVRQLLANTPIRVVATLHDTSVVMIERTYSKFITDHSDACPAVHCSIPLKQGSMSLDAANLHKTLATPIHESPRKTL